MMPGRSQIRRTLRRATLFTRRVASEQLIERRRGIETGRVVDLDALGIESEERVRYEPSGWLDLRRALRGRDVGPDDVFLDLGSGKGRVVLAAARYPFKRVIGVELSEQLNDVARRNLKAMQPKLRCRAVEIVSADVVDYEIPDDVTLVYLYNPFRGAVFDAAMRKLIASVDRRPRTVRVLYRTPLERARLEATGRFRLERVVHGLRPRREWSRYRSLRVYALEPRPGSASAAEDAVSGRAQAGEPGRGEAHGRSQQRAG
jgi:SAM-dependent methyltransferase